MTRMPRWFLLAAQLALLAALSLAPGAALRHTARGAPAHPPLRHVVIMSFDGARADAVREVMPETLLSQAAYSWDAQTTMPSTTLPSHTSMLTGVGPDVHRVQFNWDNPRGHIRLPTVFSVATEDRKIAAAFVAKSKLLYLVRPGTAAHTEFLPFPAYRQLDVVREAIRYLARARPHLLFIHMADPDDAGHRSGWMSPSYLAVVRSIPEAIDSVLDVLSRMYSLEESLIIVTSDHGGHGQIHGTSDPRDMTIPWVSFGSVQPGPIRRSIVTYDTAATAVAALGITVPPSWQGRPVLESVGSKQ